MDPRDTPGYRMHRALSNLNDIEVDQLNGLDRRQIETATTLLEKVSLLTRPESSEATDVQVEF